MISSKPIELSGEQREALAQAIVRDLPRFSGRVRSSQTTELVQPFFRHHKIVDVSSPVPMPSMRAHVVCGPSGELAVLTDHLARLNEVVDVEPAQGLDDLETLKLYASNCDFWTSEAEWGELVVTKIDDVHWRVRLKPGAAERIAQVTERLGREIRPLEVTRAGAETVVTFWVQSKQRIVRRELHLDTHGHVRRVDVVREADLPVYLGQTWGMINGKLVPTG